MTTPKLSFQEITVHRMPGFPTGGLSVEDLSPGVNIIYGPNASGKSTLCRAMQRLLRPHETPHNHDTLFASLDCRGANLTVHYDLGQVKCQQDGADVDCPTLAPADVKDRYVLALQDLIHAEDGGDLAGLIRRELAGGYDVAEAASALGYRNRPTNRSKSKKDLDVARSARRKIEADQKALAAKEEELGTLNQERSAARQAQMRLEWLEKALDLKSAEERLQLAQEHLASFPAGVSELRGDELEQLEKIRQQRKQAELRCVVESDHLESAEQKRSSCGLPPDGLPSGQLGTLRRQCERLQTHAMDLQSAEKAVEEASAQSREARAVLGPALPESDGESLDLAALEDLASFARRAENLRGEVAASDALGDWLDVKVLPEAVLPKTVSPEDDLEQLSQAVRLLDRWMAASEETSRQGPPRNWLLGIAGAVVLLSIVMSLAFHGLWLLLLSAAVVLLAWAFGSAGQADSGDLSRRELERLDCGVPEGWTTEQVRPFARQMQKRVATATLRREQAAKWGSLDQRRAHLTEQQAQLMEEKSDWTQRLGIDPRHAESDEAWLYLLAANINRLQEAEQRLQAAEAQRTRAAGHFETLLEEINTALQSYGIKSADSTEAAAAALEELNDRRERFDEGQNEITAAQKELTRIDQEAETLDQEVIELFARLGLKVSEEKKLIDWTDQYQEYLEAAQTLRDAQRDRNTTQSLLSERPELAEHSRDALHTDREECQQKAQRLESISSEITEIETLLREAKKSTNLEAAIAEEETCADALRELRGQDAESMVGGLLADYLNRQEQDREGPKVFQRARELFVHITHGRYRLDIDSGDPPAFRAFDTSRGEGLTLDQLSSGTRLQLLLAVRVAFVERQETDLKLPLILDETLGNSDERRATQIIEAAIEICRQGRQVFYLTAQHDEVGKWNTILERHDDVPSRLVDLAELRGFSDIDRIPPMIYERPELVEVPVPETDDWLAYGSRLGVPRFDPYEEIGGLHLWYVIDDVEMLYQLLKQDINKWGQLQNLVRHGHNGFLSDDTEIFETAKAAARVLEAAGKHWRTGRGMPVDRKVLLDSGAVTEKYIDSVSELAADLEGNAQRLIEAIESGSVRGFQKKKCRDLQEYLQDHGFLDARDVWSSEQIREEVRIAEFAALEKEQISRERFKQLISIVTQGSAAAVVENHLG